MNARAQLKQAGAFDIEMAAMAGQKIGKKLRSRIADYNHMINDPANRTRNMAGYHKPGSHK